MQNCEFDELMENTHAPDDEIDLLDLLVTISENIKLLVLGPLVAGLLALGVAFTLPQSFQSQAMINSGFEVTSSDGRTNFSGVRPELLVAMAHTSAVLEPVRQQIGFMPEASTELALNELRVSIKASLGRADKLVTITVTAPSAEQAQRTNQALLAELFKQSQPRGADLARLNAKLQFEKEALGNALKLEQELIAIIKSGKDSDTTTYVNVSRMKGAHFDAIQSLESQLQGLAETALMQPATLPEKPLSNNKAQLAIVTTFATAFALLLFVFIRKALLSAAANPKTAAKLASIRRAFRLRYVA
jgi:predicted XRE-type DNA-binding protein